MDEAVREAQQKIYDEAGQVVPPKSDWYSWSVSGELPPALHHRMSYSKPTVTSIRAADINGLLSVSGTVIRTGVIKLLHSRRSTCAQVQVPLPMRGRHRAAQPDAAAGRVPRTDSPPSRVRVPPEPAEGTRSAVTTRRFASRSRSTA